MGRVKLKFLCGNSVHLKMSGGVYQSAVVNIHQELEVAEEICTEYSIHDICNNKHPTEDAS